MKRTVKLGNKAFLFALGIVIGGVALLLVVGVLWGIYVAWRYNVRFP
jgi:hypothetical protein